MVAGWVFRPHTSALFLTFTTRPQQAAWTGGGRGAQGGSWDVSCVWDKVLASCQPAGLCQREGGREIPATQCTTEHLPGAGSTLSTPRACGGE